MVAYIPLFKVTCILEKDSTVEDSLEGDVMCKKGMQLFNGLKGLNKMR